MFFVFSSLINIILKEKVDQYFLELNSLLKNANENLANLLLQNNSYPILEGKLKKSLELKEQEFKETQCLSEQLELENGKILLEIDSFQENLNFIQANIECCSKNIEFQWKFPDEIIVLDRNIEFMNKFQEGKHETLQNTLNALLS